jgi:hypothetical protein
MHNTGNPDQALLRKLIATVIIKLALLGVLWWMFVQDQRVEVQTHEAAQHLLTPASSPGNAQGANP